MLVVIKSLNHQHCLRREYFHRAHAMLMRNFCLLLLLNCCTVFSYKILMVCSPPSRSHYNLCKAVTNILTERNHEVTFITAFASDNPKHREMQIDLKHFFTVIPSVLKLTNMSITQTFPTLISMTNLITDAIFTNADVQKMLDDKTEKFDLVILEYFVNQNLLGFSVRYDCPAILLTGISMMPWVTLATSNPFSIATAPSFMTDYSINMNLWERLLNTLVQIFENLTETFYFSPTLEKLYLKYFPEESLIVPFYELKHKVSAVLSNTHHSINPTKALLPNVAEVAGYHIEDPAPLPEDLQIIMDNANDGVIFFSMGSIVKTNEMKPQFREAIINSLSKFKQTILWKFDDEIKDLPKNIVTKKWLPQTSILAHRNIKLFITHGGFLSCTEATHFAVPIITIPVFGDQFHNAKLFSDRGQGLTIAFNNFSESSLTWSVQEILNNTKYAEKSREISALYHDRPVKPRDLLAYQVEHVIRTDGGPHLSPPYLPKYSLLLLDVIAILFAIIIAFILLLRYIFHKILCKKTNKIKMN